MKRPDDMTVEQAIEILNRDRTTGAEWKLTITHPYAGVVSVAEIKERARAKLKGGGKK